MNNVSCSCAGMRLRILSGGRCQARRVKMRSARFRASLGIHGKLGHINPVAVVASAGDNFMQEDNLLFHSLTETL